MRLLVNNLNKKYCLIIPSMVLGLCRLWFFENDSSVFEKISGLCAAGTALKEQSYIDQAHQVILRKILVFVSISIL